LLIRCLFGFSSGSFLSGAIDIGATSDAAKAIEAYTKERVPTEKLCQVVCPRISCCNLDSLKRP